MANVRIKDLPAFSGTLPTSAVFALETEQATQKIDFATLKAAIGGGGGSGAANYNDVNFYDYDGTLVYSYSEIEFMRLSEMPANPVHEGLTAQGWNWSLSDAQTYVNNYGVLDIGQMYITSDGKTRIYIHLEEGRTSPMLGVCPNGSVDVDWGDNSTHDTLTGSSVSVIKWTQTHTYSAPGNYVILLSVTGTMGISGNNGATALLRFSSTANDRNTIYARAIEKIEIGENVTKVGDYSFMQCFGLKSITLPTNITNIGSYLFYKCLTLKSAILPSLVTGNTTACFYECNSMLSVSLPKTIDNIGDNAFSNCFSLIRITIPDGILSIGDYAFENCYCLMTINFPGSLTSIGAYAFDSCYALSEIVMPAGISIINNASFQGNWSLRNVQLSFNVTQINYQAFYQCSSLSKIVIPSEVTNIGDGAFGYCTGLSEIHIQALTPPTVAGNAHPFLSIPADCIFYVPEASVNAYKQDSFWELYESRIQAEPE